ncbi:hypothetical protein [Spiroplasma endosymbiont of Polydrusus formosus]|uniref:hypothetical protein n=1 Tax=Spiroplasma endosymbiont of Polydrusus formosus TaxID=3139326 RepID=UPI0035B5516C
MNNYIEQLLAAKVDVLLPRVVENNLQFHHIYNLTTDLELNSQFGIYEPLTSLLIINVKQIELVVFVIIVAFGPPPFSIGYKERVLWVLWSIFNKISAHCLGINI